MQELSGQRALVTGGTSATCAAPSTFRFSPPQARTKSTSSTGTSKVDGATRATRWAPPTEHNPGGA